MKYILVKDIPNLCKYIKDWPNSNYLSKYVINKRIPIPNHVPTWKLLQSQPEIIFENKVYLRVSGEFISKRFEML